MGIYKMVQCIVFLQRAHPAEVYISPACYLCIRDGQSPCLLLDDTSRPLYTLSHSNATFKCSQTNRFCHEEDVKENHQPIEYIHVYMVRREIDARAFRQVWSKVFQGGVGFRHEADSALRSLQPCRFTTLTFDHC